jgi:DNA repair photolyase
MEQRLPDLPRKGRGAVSNATGRFEPTRYERVDDGWRGAETSTADDEPAPLRTTVTLDTTRTAIVRNKSPDIPFDRSVNPYRGCEHGCVYCFARPTHAFLGLSPGLDFESRLLAKPDAPMLLAEELRKRGYQVEPLALGTNTDPYQPIEREYKITRGILEVLSDFNHPVMITTKSTLILRDIDILAPMAAKGLARAALSVTTLDPATARAMEPRAPRPERRLETVRALSEAGIPTSVLTAPIIPALNDWEIERLLEASAAHGAVDAGYVLLRLPLEIKDLFTEWLEAHFPKRAKHVLALMREMRGGKLYDAEFGARFSGKGPYAEMIAKRFRLACNRLGLEKNRAHLDCSQFKPPARAGDQLALF